MVSLLINESTTVQRLETKNKMKIHNSGVHMVHMIFVPEKII